MGKLVRIHREAWNRFLADQAARLPLFAPTDVEGRLAYERISGDRVPAIVYDRARPVTPLKLFLFPFKESVLPAASAVPGIVVMGPASCDLAGLEILDKVFSQGEFKDPSFGRRRESILLVSFDCQAPYPSCFCESVGIRPYPERSFDLNLTAVPDGLILEIGSEKGERFIAGLRSADTPGSHEKTRDEIRSRTREKVREANRGLDLSKVSESIRGVAEGERWKAVKDIGNCVQCGSCNFNCPTCVCFLLEDFSSDEMMHKARIWDACLFPGYARMAGGATPRRSLHDRYANRLLCKYEYMVANFGQVGCTGCGRCISGCIGKIDKRKVLTEVMGSMAAQ